MYEKDGKAGVGGTLYPLLAVVILHKERGPIHRKNAQKQDTNEKNSDIEKMKMVYLLCKVNGIYVIRKCE